MKLKHCTLGSVTIIALFLMSSITMAGIKVPTELLRSWQVQAEKSAKRRQAQLQLETNVSASTGAFGANVIIRLHPTTNSEPFTNVIVIPAGTNAQVTTIPITNNIGRRNESITNLVILPPRTNAEPVTNMVVIPPITNAEPTNITIIGGTNKEGALLNAPVSGLVTNLTASIQMYADELTKSEFGPTFAKAFYVGEVTVLNPFDKPILVYSSSLKVPVRFFMHPKDANKLDPEARKFWTNNYLPTVRTPGTFADILAIFDYQQEKNWKQRTVEILKSVGQVAAGATMFVGGATYPKAVAFATGIIAPELQKHLLWDLVMHAKNLESRSLQEIEEVPPYKPITKLVFFPKGGIPGIVPMLLVYISAFPPQLDIEVHGSKLVDQEGIQTGPAELQ